MNIEPVRDFMQKVARPHGHRLQKNTASDGEVWFYGTVVTPFGYVHVHSEPGFTSLSAMHDGYEVNRYMRGVSFSKRGLVTVARRLIEEIQ